MNTKTCCGCRKTKTLDEFHKNSSSKDGLQRLCKLCRKTYVRQHYLDNKETYAEQARKYAKENSAELIEYKRSYYQRKGRAKLLLVNYGLTEEQYNEIYENQGGACAVCHKHGSTEKRSLNVDHNHDTGEIRGLLCAMCNRKFIAHRTDPEIFESAARYLRKGLGLFVPKGKERPKRRRKRKSNGKR